MVNTEPPPLGRSAQSASRLMLNLGLSQAQENKNKKILSLQKMGDVIHFTLTEKEEVCVLIILCIFSPVGSQSSLVKNK